MGQGWMQHGIQTLHPAASTRHLSEPLSSMILGGPSGTRTRDLRIKSPQLYRLSYQPDCFIRLYVCVVGLVISFRVRRRT